jgi:ubiquitin C-terminal hydrolase
VPPATSAAEAWAAYTAWHRSRVSARYAGVLASTLTCAACGRANTTFDPSWCLALPVPDSGGFSGGDTSPTLQSCFAQYVAPERLTGAERAWCEACAARRDATVQLRVARWPAMLVVQLKRFRYTLASRTKVGTPVAVAADAPLRLAPDAPAYALVGVVCHSGGLGGGHYYAHARHPGPSGAWATFNDSSARPLTSAAELAELAAGPTPYLLLLRRIEVAAPAKL